MAMAKGGVNGVFTLNGPRRLTVSGDGLQVYVVAIFSSAVTWFDRNASTGHLSLAGSIEDSSYGIDGLGAPQKILISPDGHHAYVTAPGDSSITWLDRNASNGNLTFPSAVGPSFEITEDDLGSVLSVSASFVDGNELVIICAFLIQLPSGASMNMDVVYPLQTLKPIASQLRSRVQSDTNDDVSWREKMETAILSIPLHVTALLGEPLVSMGRLIRLQSGDVVSVNVQDGIRICVEDTPMFVAEMGEVSGQAAVSLSKRL